MGKRPKLQADEGKLHNGMLPDRDMPATKKLGVIASVKDTIKILRGKS